MSQMRCQPGMVRDAIVEFLSQRPTDASVVEITNAVVGRLGRGSASSVRSYLLANTPATFQRRERGRYQIRRDPTPRPRRKRGPKLTPAVESGSARLFQADCFDWLLSQDSETIHAVVTDPPYGLVEYSTTQQAKMRNGKGGVWRIPPSFDGFVRSPLPRFTTLREDDLENLAKFFSKWAKHLRRVLVPGAHVLLASNPLLAHRVATAISSAGFETRGSIVRLVMTMRGGDRPKNAHDEFAEVSVMPRSMWEPWLVFRKPIEGRVQDNLRKWGTGGFRRPSEAQPFGDVIRSAPTRANERAIAPHPSLKPQQFLRQVVRAVLPLGDGIVLDPFAGSGSTLAACEAVGYESIGVELDPHYVQVARSAIPKLRDYNSAQTAL
jgi:DNA modification methylase